MRGGLSGRRGRGAGGRRRVTEVQGEGGIGGVHLISSVGGETFLEV